MEIPTIKADRRTEVGTRVSRLIREQGLLPGIIYGHGETPEAFQLSAHEFKLHLRDGVRLLKVDFGGQAGDYLIKDVQYDHLQKDPVHIDLTRVDLNERITVNVSIELRGTPKGIADGGILDHILDHIEIECLASGIPQTLHPSVADLGVGDALTAGDLELPAGVALNTDPDVKIAAVNLLATKSATATEEGDEPSSTEPERIGGRPEDQGDDSGDSK